MAISFTAGKPKSAPTGEYHVEKGDYNLRIIGTKEDTTRNGNDVIEVEFRVIHPDGTDGPNFKEGLVFTQKAAWKIDSFLKSCGKHPGEGNPIELDADDMVGWECKAFLKVREFQKKDGTPGKSNEVGAFLFSDDEGF